LTANNGTADVMTTTRAYDNLDRLTSISQAASGQTVSSHAYTYNDANQRTRADLADGSYWVYQYDALGQVTSGIRHWADGTVADGQSFGYAFDDIGNRTSGGRTGSQETYTANDLNQYSQRTVPGAIDLLGEADPAAIVTVTLPEPAPVGTTYATARHDRYYHAAIPVDNAGNAVWQELDIVGVQPLAGPNGEDIVSQQSGHVFVPATPEAYTHDDDGNLLADGRWSYTWDAENRLVAMQTTAAVVPGTRLEFTYDAHSRRIERRTYTGTTDDWTITETLRFVYDGWNLVAELNASGAAVRNHTWGLDLSGTLQGAGGVGGLLATTVHATAATTHFPAYDGNGNITLYLADDGTGTLAATATFEYSPFGRPLQATGSAAAILPFRFSTKYRDAKTTLYYYGYRYYNAQTGRWINRDPIGEAGGHSIYAFVRNSDISAHDSLGLVDEEGQAVLQRILQGQPKEIRHIVIESRRMINEKVAAVLHDALCQSHYLEHGGILEQGTHRKVKYRENRTKVFANLEVTKKNIDILREVGGYIDKEGNYLSRKLGYLGDFRVELSPPTTDEAIRKIYFAFHTHPIPSSYLSYVKGQTSLNEMSRGAIGVTTVPSIPSAADMEYARANRHLSRLHFVVNPDYIYVVVGFMWRKKNVEQSPFIAIGTTKDLLRLKKDMCCWCKVVNGEMRADPSARLRR
jgi:RHS repeat-associated protein